jgi:hypothetical protein
MPIDHSPQICRTVDVTPGRAYVIEVEVDQAKQLRSFVVPAGVTHLAVCINHRGGDSNASSANVVISGRRGDRPVRSK